MREKFLGRGKGWRYTYTVRGTWPFPTDMLRYDDAEAASSHDQSVIDRLSGENAPEDMSLEELRRSTTVTLFGLHRPTERRWRSFGWRVEA